MGKSSLQLVTNFYTKLLELLSKVDEYSFVLIMAKLLNVLEQETEKLNK